MIVIQSQIDAALKDLLKKFKYYRLSLYTFSMASMMEIMLGGNFKEEYIAGIKAEIEKLSCAYRELFEECSGYIEKMGHASVKINILKGFGIAGKTVGNFIGNIPVIKEGPVDEFLQEKGMQMSENAHNIESSILSDFGKINSPKTRVFIERMEDLIRIYNHTSKIYFDNTHIYLTVS